MTVLAIDTCGPAGSIALGRLEDGAVTVLAQTEMPGKTYSAELVPAIRALLESQNISAASLGVIVVLNGPGSFTGVRIGLSSAKGFAEGLAIPLVAVSRLAVLAWKASVTAAALDAGRGEFYYRREDREALLAAKDMPESGTVAVCESGPAQVFPSPVLVEPPTAADALCFGVPCLIARDFANLVTVDGNYVRRSDAEIFTNVAGNR